MSSQEETSRGMGGTSNEQVTLQTVGGSSSEHVTLQPTGLSNEQLFAMPSLFRHLGADVVSQAPPTTKSINFDKQIQNINRFMDVTNLDNTFVGNSFGMNNNQYQSEHFHHDHSHHDHNHHHHDHDFHSHTSDSTLGRSGNSREQPASSSYAPVVAGQPMADPWSTGYLDMDYTGAGANSWQMNDVD